jgi:5-methylcytosine-specific restriction endonuclease McrA
MAPPIKQVPLKTCRYCLEPLERKRYPAGDLEPPTLFARRHFCHRNCMAAWMTGRIKILNTKNSYRQSARMVKPACEICGRFDTRLHVHHMDGDPLNNDKRNLQTLCGSCHRLSHSRKHTGIMPRQMLCEH